MDSRAVLKNIIRDRDINGLRNISDDILNQFDSFLPYIIKKDWEEGIKEYQSRYKNWAWAIKNCFTIWAEMYDPYVCFHYCPESYKKETIDKVNSYGELIGDYSMIAFPYKYIFTPQVTFSE